MRRMTSSPCCSASSARGSNPSSCLVIGDPGAETWVGRFPLGGAGRDVGKELLGPATGGHGIVRDDVDAPSAFLSVTLRRRGRSGFFLGGGVQ
mmetsp:Transcript_11451/g.29340  ORF Transcript_11451/g.29340 Transcript_11451/m.29340 type:complete len:93 (+) Transcript_11451:1370-1648(+)